ncbi:4-galactosyl-N-acetylglucosaminide 3-alpha-L-fucosyltransferase 9-like isoform X2 [Puntigrus tetrazona]|uniref:4-galactosyl-N-acetylglucosaminide 3-alpha-L-fucosyltransferase 9-like isoform X2 n=1 Tax=Puntigrus tetrazona TaxID=1606681 RepID=UPI001C8A95CF|nr:4-galactosyl-N-acetylglucosaminide 3-alpha-L-fucosyltransferase 9-like isoform X2 [Puntigrus tetrazona]
MCRYAYRKNDAMDKTTVTTISKTTQYITIAMFLMACFTIYMCCNSTKHLFGKSIAARVQINNISAETCLSVLKTQNYKCAANTTPDEHLIGASKEKEEPDTLLLIWMWPFRDRFELAPCSSAFDIHGCRLTDDRDLFNQAHGVMFHHRDISRDLSNMPQLPRPAFQKWVWWNMESPSNSYPLPLLKDLFNLTSSYRWDSDIPVPYGRITYTREEEKKYTIPKKDRLVCWVVSNYNPDFKRSQYYTELVKSVKVSVYGRQFNNAVNGEEYTNLVSSCKFYLSFENSIHRDYVTEKLFNALVLGAVPVVLGPPRENYELFLPSEAFIHVDDFPSAKELAEHLKLLDQNEDLYKRHFTWRERFVSKTNIFGLEHACRICDHIRRNKHYKVVKDLNSWFWS